LLLVFSWLSGDGVPASIDRHQDRVPTGGAVGKRRLAVLGLGGAGLVGGPYLEPVAAGAGVPAPHPLPPGVGADDVAEFGLVPGALVDAHLHGADAAMLGPGDPGD